MMQDGTELTTESVQIELSEIQAWLQDFSQRQQQSTNATVRAAFLNGWLARDAVAEEPPAESVSETPQTELTSEE